MAADRLTDLITGSTSCSGQIKPHWLSLDTYFLSLPGGRSIFSCYYTENVQPGSQKPADNTLSLLERIEARQTAASVSTGFSYQRRAAHSWSDRCRLRSDSPSAGSSCSDSSRPSAPEFLCWTLPHQRHRLNWVNKVSDWVQTSRGPRRFDLSGPAGSQVNCGW